MFGNELRTFDFFKSLIDLVRLSAESKIHQMKKEFVGCISFIFNSLAYLMKRGFLRKSFTEHSKKKIFKLNFFDFSYKILYKFLPFKKTKKFSTIRRQKNFLKKSFYLSLKRSKWIFQKLLKVQTRKRFLLIYEQRNYYQHNWRRNSHSNYRRWIADRVLCRTVRFTTVGWKYLSRSCC